MFGFGYNPFGQLRNRLRLITGGFVGSDKIKHGQPNYGEMDAPSNQANFARLNGTQCDQNLREVWNNVLQFVTFEPQDENGEFQVSKFC